MRNPRIRNTETLGSINAGETALAAPIGALTPALGVELTGNGAWRISATWAGRFGSGATVDNLSLAARCIW